MNERKIVGGCTLWARQTINSGVFNKPDKWFKIWFYIVSRANHTDNGQLKRGQCHLTYKSIMLNCKATKSQVAHCVYWLKNEGMIVTSKSTRGFIVTIYNYQSYQDLSNYKMSPWAQSGRKLVTAKATQNPNVKPIDSGSYVNHSDTFGNNKRNTKGTQKLHYKQECCNNENRKNNSHLLQIFDHWNIYKGKQVVKNGQTIRWHSHQLKANGLPSPEVQHAIKRALTDKHSPDQICAAISNYSKILLGADYIWSYVWTLPDFLNRGEERHRQAARKWWRFLPDNFIEEHYFTEAAKRKRSSKESGTSIALAEMREHFSQKIKQTGEKQDAVKAG